MKSMTGYGGGQALSNGCKIAIELASVNRRQTEIFVNLPREFETLEPRIRQEINRVIARGRVAVRVSIQSTATNRPSVQINVPLARAYARALAHLAKTLNFADAVTLDQVLRAPGVLQNDEETPQADEIWPGMAKALGTALDRLVNMRKKEGGHLARDLVSRMKKIRLAVKRIAREAPQVSRRFQQQLLERIQAAGLNIPGSDDERLLREVVLFADRADISEELTRLESHFRQFDEALGSSEPVGRLLDFLSQEMNREINTIGSKGNDSLISREVVIIKAELEKFREQVQNIE